MCCISHEYHAAYDGVAIVVDRATVQMFIWLGIASEGSCNQRELVYVDLRGALGSREPIERPVGSATVSRQS